MLYSIYDSTLRSVMLCYVIYYMLYYAKVFAAKSGYPDLVDYQELASQDLEVAPGEACRLPVVFVGSWVKLEFPGGWPQVAGTLLQLAVRVVKVWRLRDNIQQRQH